jgi:hypothetical protein
MHRIGGSAVAMNLNSAHSVHERQRAGPEQGPAESAKQDREDALAATVAAQVSDSGHDAALRRSKQLGAVLRVGLIRVHLFDPVHGRETQHERKRRTLHEHGELVRPTRRRDQDLRHRRRYL